MQNNKAWLWSSTEHLPWGQTNNSLFSAFKYAVLTFMNKILFWTLQKRKNGNLKNKQNYISYPVIDFLFNRSCSKRIKLIRIKHVIKHMAGSMTKLLSQFLPTSLLHFILPSMWSWGCPALCSLQETQLRLSSRSPCFPPWSTPSFNPSISSLLVSLLRVYLLLLKIHSLVLWAWTTSTNCL